MGLPSMRKRMVLLTLVAWFSSLDVRSGFPSALGENQGFKPSATNPKPTLRQPATHLPSQTTTRWPSRHAHLKNELQLLLKTIRLEAGRGSHVTICLQGKGALRPSS